MDGFAQIFPILILISTPQTHHVHFGSCCSILLGFFNAGILENHLWTYQIQIAFKKPLWKQDLRSNPYYLELRAKQSDVYSCLTRWWIQLVGLCVLLKPNQSNEKNPALLLLSTRVGLTNRLQSIIPSRVSHLVRAEYGPYFDPCDIGAPGVRF